MSFALIAIGQSVLCFDCDWFVGCLLERGFSVSSGTSVSPLPAPQAFESAWSSPSIFKGHEWAKLVQDVGPAFSVRSLRAFECAEEDKCVGVGLDADKNCFCYT